MIISKAPTLTNSQLAEVEAIVGGFGCKIQVIYGAHRNIYAIIGDERSETMVNRLLGLEYIDRVDRMESVYKLMDKRSDLANHKTVIGGVELGKEPLFIAGHCTIDPDNGSAFLETAEAVKEAGAHVIRGGVWKPRTSPHSFQGTAKSMDFLLEARQRTGLPVIAEVMDEAQLKYAVEAKVDMLQIGTRNALNYTLLAEIGRQTAEVGIPVLLKRGRHMGPVDEFISAAEYIVANGNPNVIFCPRGTMPALDGFRNHPDESVTPLLKEKSWVPVIADPSHSVGRAKYVPACSLASIAYGADGLVIESHVNPITGIGDDPKQSITPDVLKKLIQDARILWDLVHS
ncbi:3-deoxy-D-arabino-heptulosonate 7-phosphate synthase [Puniceicoccales bacterium CK1056]|uniref:3-deoxy-D-arabino-heptulosonate 7-phosphate synthase n=1 Tax=Oceanipulchritudo coccoides TaxID=2706888 RepID=A0A6B2M317_9BACT|nr:3-deoxy-D-arabino-heptulosonate 7-phosphate synthase [Oceanipulchritudo coccoides]NDV62477.1 3-deoxy-D-arabino-heptulosonate 7-phosphate synthase [Oceanipulchritudo coccoides]